MNAMADDETPDRDHLFENFDLAAGELAAAALNTLSPTQRQFIDGALRGALETTRGWRITKEKAIDVVVALGMAALGVVKGAYERPRGPAVF